MKNQVLIVEDDKEINSILTAFLEENGYKVWNAFDGHDATKQFTKRSYDVILMDLMLPFKSGEQLIKELRINSETPVIVLSAKDMM